MRSKLSSFMLIALFSFSVLFIVNVNTHLTSSAQTQAQGFQIIGAKWGNSTAGAEAGPGSQDVPLTLTLQYLYPYSALYAQVDVLLPSGFSSTSTSLAGNASNNATIYYTSSLEKGQVFQVETFVNLASNVSLGSYTFPTTLLWSAVLTNSTSAPEVSLEQNTNFAVTVEGSTKLSFSSSQTALTPGQINNITLTLANSGTGNASDIETTITSSNPAQVSVLNQFPNVNELSPQQSSANSIELFVSSSAAGSSVSLSITTTYLDAYTNQVTNTQTMGLFVSTTSSTSQLVYSVNQNSLTPGEVNNLTLSVTNEGSETLTGVSTDVTTSSQTISVLSEPNVIPSISPGNSASLEIGLFVSATSSNTAATLTITSTFTVLGPNDTGSVTQNLGLYVSSQSGSSSNSSLSVQTVKNDLLTGVPSSVLFNITNTGSSPIFDPVFSLSVASPLVIMSNSTYSLNGGEISPGQSILYRASISSSPSATIGVYDGDLSVAYSNTYGISNTQTTQVGFVLTGTIELVIQDETVSQGTGNLTVSGSLLDEGTASAYYASVVGFTNSTSSDPAGPVTYIGEIDPNTPVPFSTTVPYVLRGSTEQLKVVLELTYKDSFGNDQVSNFNTTTVVTAAAIAPPVTTGSGTSSSAVALVQAALYAIIVVVVVAAVVGVIVVRRKRRQTRVESGQEAEEAPVV